MKTLMIAIVAATVAASPVMACKMPVKPTKPVCDNKYQCVDNYSNFNPKPVTPIYPKPKDVNKKS